MLVTHFCSNTVECVLISILVSSAFMSQEPKNSCPSCSSVGKKYMQETSLHGLKYIIEENRHFLERLFWIIIAAVSWGFATYLIYRVIDKWQKSPILVAFQSAQTPIWRITFPAITICNMNKVMKSRVEHIDEELHVDPDNEFYRTEYALVDEICAKHEKFTANHGNDDHDMHLSGDLLHEYLTDLAQPCDTLLLRCHFEVGR